MSAARCPKCSATLLGSVDWCSQCYADLRPAAPAAPAGPPAGVSPSTPAAVSAPPMDAGAVPVGTSAPDPLLTSLVTGPLDTPLARATAEALADPLTAPIGYVAGAEPAAAAVAAAAGADAPRVAGADAPPVATTPPLDGWPCVRCGALNEMDRMACGSCGQAFGADLATPLRVPGTRQSRILVTIGIVFSVLAMLAVVIYATTPDPPAKEKTRPESTQPAEELVEEPLP